MVSLFLSQWKQVNEKITYSKWKASSIAKAFREGRTPTPGPANAPAGQSSSSNLPSPPVDGETQHQNDSSEELSRQLLGGSKSDVIDLSNDQDDEYTTDSRFALPPPPNDNPGSPPRSLPSVPDIPTSPSLSPRNELQRQQHPSAPPDIPDFSSFSNDTPPSSSRPASTFSTQPPIPSRQVAASAPSRSQPVQQAPEEWQPEPSTVDTMTIEAAQKHAKWAISALNYEDLDTARQELRKALSLIGG